MHKKGFTLAEVLITLGIIGVVAAITIPTLVQNYQKVVWVNQLKKSISVLENSIHLYLAEEGVSKLSETQELGKNVSAYQTFNTSQIFNLLKNYIKFIKISGSGDDYSNNKSMCKTLSGWTCDYDDVPPGGKAYLQDGSVFIIYVGGNVAYDYMDIAIDVNGDKRPNQIGRDIFKFVMKDNGTLVPYDIDDCYEDSYGRGCAKRIIEKGWKMDY
mgnify:CR=1 FL=1